MLVFVELQAGDGALALLRAASKQELPLEDLVVVAAQLAVTSVSAAPRQLTCISARVKPTGRRVLLALPIAVPVAAASSSESTAVQILDTGDVAVQFARDVRSCFPTLVRRNPMVLTVSDSDDESDTDGTDGTDNTAASRSAGQRESQSTKQRQAQQQRDAERAASGYMDRTRVKMLPSLHELLHAFEVADAAQTRAALQHEERAVLASVDNDSPAEVQCQWLCVSLPALALPAATFSNSSDGSGSSSMHNVGLLLSHAVSSSSIAQFLSIPLPRPPRAPDSSSSADNTCEMFQDATVLSFGAKREATAHGGGKTPAEMINNIRMRHASGTFVTLVEPATTWSAVAASYAAFLPQVRAVEGELRLRRIVGPATTSEPLQLLLLTAATAAADDDDDDDES